MNYLTPESEQREYIERCRAAYLGNEDIDPKVFAAWGDACEKAAQEQFLREHDAAIAQAATLAENKRVLDAIQKFKTEAWERHDLLRSRRERAHLLGGLPQGVKGDAAQANTAPHAPVRRARENISSGPDTAV